MVYRIYVEKKQGLENEASSLLSEIKTFLGAKGVTKVRIINRYDVENITPELFSYAVKTVFSEPQLDNVTEKLENDGAAIFAVEYLPGQFDQRADSASQCIQLISQGERPLVRSAKVYVLYGDISAEELLSIKKYVINPVEAREASLDEKETLKASYDIPKTVKTLDGFISLDKKGLEDFVKSYGLAMDVDDIEFCQSYFAKEGRDPTLTEIRMIDTYWSDHCRHTTFGTELTNVVIDDEQVRET